MAKRFGRNQRRALRDEIAALKTRLLFGLHPAKPDDLNLDHVVFSNQLLSIDDSDEGRDITLFRILILPDREGEGTMLERIFQQHANEGFFAIEGRSYRMIAMDRPDYGPFIRIPCHFVGIPKRLSTRGQPKI